MAKNFRPRPNWVPATDTSWKPQTIKSSGGGTLTNSKDPVASLPSPETNWMLQMVYTPSLAEVAQNSGATALDDANTPA